MSATMRDIAERARVSPQVVSMVLHGGRSTSKVSAATHERVTSAARELGYRPNASARATRTGRFGTVGMLMSSVDPHYTVQSFGMLLGIVDDLREAGLSLTMSEPGDEKLDDAVYVPHILRQTCCDGLLVNFTNDFPPHLLELIGRHRIPAIWINSKLEHDCVYPDDFEGAYQVTQRAIALGHRRIAYIGSDGTHYSLTDRREGYCRAMVETGLAPAVVARFDTNAPPTERLAWARGLLDAAGRPTCFVCYSWDDAVLLWHLAETMGLHVPGDLSLASFADKPITPLGRTLTVMHIPLGDVGKAAVRMLIAKMGGAGSGDACPMELTLSEGDTLGQAQA